MIVEVYTCDRCGFSSHPVDSGVPPNGWSFLAHGYSKCVGKRIEICSACHDSLEAWIDLGKKKYDAEKT